MNSIFYRHIDLIPHYDDVLWFYPKHAKYSDNLAPKLT